MYHPSTTSLSGNFAKVIIPHCEEFSHSLTGDLIAARLEGLAKPGDICISGTVYDQIENKLALGYKYLGEQTVKNIAKPVRVIGCS
jgi:hypothetical protein